MFPQEHSGSSQSFEQAAPIAEAILSLTDFQ